MKPQSSLKWNNWIFKHHRRIEQFPDTNNPTVKPNYPNQICLKVKESTKIPDFNNKSIDVDEDRDTNATSGSMIFSVSFNKTGANTGLSLILTQFLLNGLSNTKMHHFTL